nr:40S ribosomal protein S3 [Cryptomonas curvata]
MSLNVSKQKKFIIDGVFFSELNEFLSKELYNDGYSDVILKKTPLKTEMILKTTRTQSIIGLRGKRIREITLLIKKRFDFGDNKLDIYVEKIANRGLCANVQAESLRFKLLKGLAVRRACYGILRSTMESGAKGCLITVSGKLRAQRAKTMKFTEGYIIHSGQAVNDYISTATRHCLLRQGVIGIKISIMLPWDPLGTNGPKKPLPDMVTVLENKADY